MDIADDRDVKDCLADIQREREVNEYRHPSERQPIPGEMELLYFIIDYIQREMEVFKSEGGDPESLDFVDWLNERDALDSEAIAELHERVPGSNARIVALAILVQYSGYRLVPTSVEPLGLQPQFLLD